MTTAALAYYIRDYRNRHAGGGDALEDWYLAEAILYRGDRPAWLFKQRDFRPFGTVN